MVQDQFLRTSHKLGKAMIDVVSWTKKGQYEVWYLVQRGDEKAAFKDWFDGSYRFKGKYTLIPNQTTSTSLFEECVQLMNSTTIINIKRNNTESLLDKIIFDFHVEETKPFLKALFDRLSEACDDKQISIKELKHNEWHDRYWFAKGGATATLNFYYNQNGFFGRVEPITRYCNDPQLLNELRNVVDKLKFI